MGNLRVKAEIGASSEKLRPTEFIVDPGCFYTLVSPDMGESLGIDFPVTAHMENQEGKRVDAPLGLAYLRLLGRESPVGVCVAEVGTPRLGSTALQALGMKYNEQEEELHLSGLYPPPA